MEIPKRLIDFLNKNKVSYEILHHPEAFTAQTIAAAEHIKGRHHAKVVMAKAGSRHLMTVLAADQRIDLQKLEKISSKPTSLEPEKEFKALFPDCAPGTMPPIGNLYGLPTYVDKSLAQEDYIVFEAGTHTDAIKLSYHDYERLAEPQVEDFAIKLHPIKQACSAECWQRRQAGRSDGVRHSYGEAGTKNPNLSKLLPLTVNIALPLLIYHYAAPHFGERNALILSAIPPILLSVIEFVRFQRLDAVSLLVVSGIFLSLVAMAFGDSPRLLLARESLVNGIIGLIFLGSLLLPRPLAFYLTRATMAKESADVVIKFESYWLYPLFVRSMYIMTWVWGLGLVFEAALQF